MAGDRSRWRLMRGDEVHHRTPALFDYDGVVWTVVHFEDGSKLWFSNESGSTGISALNCFIKLWLANRAITVRNTLELRKLATPTVVMIALATSLEA